MTHRASLTTSVPGPCIARPRRNLLLRGVLAAVFTLAAMSSAATAQAASRTWFVGPSGSGSACGSNSVSAPFGTVQAALGCAADGDVISLAPSGATPYPGIGTVGHSVTIKAGSGDARSVKIDLSQPQDAGGYSAGLMAVPAGASVKLQGVSLVCTGSSFGACMSQSCETTSCVGSLVTNNGNLSLTGVLVTGAQHGAAINNVATAASAARLTVTNSTIAHNTNDGLAGDGNAAGISSRSSGPGPQPQVTVVNSTIADNTAISFGQAPGGIWTNALQTGAVTLINSTVTANSGGNNAGGISDAGAGGSATPVLLSNTVVAGNITTDPNQSTAAPDCQGKLTDGPGAHNLLGSNQNCVGLTDNTNGDIVNVATPGLNALADNGGPTETVSLQAQSLAIGAADSTTCLAPPVAGLDQRGDPRRVRSSGCDIGAYDTGGKGGTVHRTWFVGPSGSGSACGSNSVSAPFGTVQAALGCAADGDVISLAPSGATPYPGIGTVGHSVTIKAGSGDARSVKIDLSQPQDAGGYSAGLMAVPAGASVKLQGVSLVCTGSSFGACMSQSCETTSCVGSLVTNNGNLSLTGVLVTGAQHGAAINNVATAASAARLTVTNSTIAHNTNDGLAGDGNAAGISSRSSGPGPQPQVTVVNSTIADNTAISFGQAPGGIWTNALQTGAVTLINSTVTANSGGNNAGGISDAGAGGSATPVLLSNTVVAGNITTDPNQSTAAPDCQGKLTDGPGAHNLLGSNQNCVGLTDNTNGDQVGSGASPRDPQLAPVALNGGSTPSAPSLAGSPVIGTANSATCNSEPVFNRDQRSQLRNVQTRDICDIGAYDTGGAAVSQNAPSIHSASSVVATESKPLSFTVTATGKPTPVLSETGKLPSGVVFADNGNGTAALSGTPVAGSAGSYPITITAHNGVAPDAQQSFVLNVAVAPTVTSIAPSTLGQGASGVTVEVNGSGFVGPVTISFTGPGTGVAATVTKITDTTLNASVRVPVTAGAGAYTLKLTNGNGTTASCNGCLTVAAGPRITDISPSSVAPGQRTAFTVSGSGFSSDAKLYGPAGVSFSAVSVNSAGTAITATMAVATTAPAGTKPVTVKNGPLGDYGSNHASLTVT